MSDEESNDAPAQPVPAEPAVQPAPPEAAAAEAEAQPTQVLAKRVRWRNTERVNEPVERPAGMWWFDGTIRELPVDQAALLENEPGFSVLGMRMVDRPNSTP